ncbi:AAA family ATPase [Rubinisphaera margarita]|uniref:AAA family ATPase n=1 Tax=Rubinisphaera margarita TaxID=2909586 RepID=UPI001EE94247|nr:AAA family ATPase [Rubinisphaera margarita]MCG6157268.1 AAA family ATPase [Rubinisphaera margarita]
MNLQNDLSELVRACFSGIWLQSFEHDDALQEIARICHDEGWKLASWDVETGLHTSGVGDVAGTSPLAAIRAAEQLADSEVPSLLVLTNFHRFLGAADVQQALARQIIAGKQSRVVIVVLAPVVQIPIELDKLFVVVEHELPDRQQLSEIAAGVATEDGELPSGADLNLLLDASAGLTRLEAENSFSLSLVRSGRLTPDSIWDLKASTLRKSGLLQLYRSQENFDYLGGLESLKAFCLRSLYQVSSDARRQPRGVLLLGVPGTGKSAFAKALGAETGRPTLVLDLGSLMGSLVGSTEQNIRRALQLADAMAPCILFIDELEKALSGSTGSGQSDSGVSTRMLGTLLTWMNDHTSNVYVVATCNDISKMPPELTRAERFDGIVFLDLPGRPQKDRIWNQYHHLFELDDNQRLPNDDQWTGAEIRACCRLSALLDVPLVQAANNVVPVAVTAAESVDSLRRWASGRCLDAEKGGIYQFTPGRTRRKSSDPFSN